MLKRSSAYSLTAVALLLGACAGPRPSELPPAPASSFTVSVNAGTSLKALAARYQVKEDDVLALNKISDRNSLSGRIRIPAYAWDREPLVTDAPRVVAGTPAPKAAPRQEPQRQGTALPPRGSVAAAPLAPPLASSLG